MNDPFGPVEGKRGVSLGTLQTLADFDYPALLSTKGTLAQGGEYLAALKAGNFYVRISIAAIDDTLSPSLEPGVPSIRERLQCGEVLAAAGIPVSLRLQPIIPGYEESAERLIKLASDCGFRHVSAEYLKLPLESNGHSFQKLEETLPQLKTFYSQNRAKRVGREFVLPADFKKSRLIHLQKVAESFGLVFGFAENELLLRNPFSACCNASDLFLRDANYFDFNVLGILRRQLAANEITFQVPEDAWLPKSSVFSHLNSKSRVHSREGDNRASWTTLLREKWNSGAWRGGPASFDGIHETGSLDKLGNKVYRHTSALIGDIAAPKPLQGHV
jgi:DNA repair photolyase